MYRWPFILMEAYVFGDKILNECSSTIHKRRVKPIRAQHMATVNGSESKHKVFGTDTILFKCGSGVTSEWNKSH